MKFHINGGVCSFVTFNGGVGVGVAVENFGAINKKTLVQLYFTQNDIDVPVDTFDLDSNSRINRFNANRSQIDLILSFDTADEVMAYILSLYSPSMDTYIYYQAKLKKLGV